MLAVSLFSVSPVFVGEDEPAELQVSQDNAVLVTVRHGVQHLSEQMPRLLLADKFPASHIRVHVTVVSGKEDVHAILTNHYVLQAADVVMVTDAGVSSQPLLLTTQRNHL